MSADAAKRARILIVDDQEANIRLLEGFLRRDGYESLRSISDPRQFLSTFAEMHPDLILLDLQMPHLDGFALMKQLAPRITGDTFLPILVLTADTNPDTKRAALALGAKDFLTKPFDPIEVLLRIKNLLETRDLSQQLKHQNEALEEKVAERTRELEETRIEILDRLALAAEFRDDATGQHTRRVGEMSALIARVVGLPDRDVDLYRRAAPLHDVGKIGVPDAILLKPGKLTPTEFEVMKTHTTIGARILAGGRSPLLLLAEEIALYHHERWDGTGYAGIAGAAIPLGGRLVALVDVFDALTHERPYKPAWPVEKALAEIQQQRGRQFDPEITEAFLSIVEQRGPGVLGVAS